MALTQVSTNGIKDATIATADIADDAVTADKLANSINTEIAANTAKATNATHTGEVTGSGALTIANDAVTSAKIADDAVGAEHIEVLDSHLQLADSCNIKLGTGDDLQIYHDGSNSYIKEAGVGELQIWSDTNLALRSDAFRLNNAANDENMIKADANGAVELYYDGTRKFRTHSAGTVFEGDLNGGDNTKLTLGNGDDLQLYHNGTNDFIQSNGGYLKIQTDSLKLHDLSLIHI